MQNLLNELKELLKKDARLVSDDHLLKNKIMELALKLDKDLIKLLLSHNDLRKYFFIDVDNTLFFDKDKFIRFISNKAFLPDSYTSFKNKIGLLVDGNYLSENKEVVIAWPYKDCVLEGGQTKEDSKRDEIFWNETLAPDEIDRLLDPKVFTNAKRVDKDGEKEFKKFNRREDGTISDNLIVKGNNLLALHSIKKHFAGKVKLIYIDPPYNTGNDSFGYNDRFNHSTWLTFMRNRLRVAKDLLKSNSAIFVHCDDNEQAYLKVLMDEIFDRDNFINTITLRVSPPEGVKTFHADKTILKEKEYLISYSKNKEQLKLKPQYVKLDEWDWHYNSYIENKSESMEKWKRVPLREKLEEEGLVADLDSKDFLRWATENSDRIYQSIDAGKYKENEKYKKDEFQWTDDHKIIVYKGRKVHFLENVLKETYNGLAPAHLLCDFWSDISFNNLFQEGGVSLLRGKKPERLIHRLISMIAYNPDDIVLDFFMGTGTTTAVAHKMSRQYIGIEQLYYGENDSTARLKNVINGDTTGISKAVKWQGGRDYVYLELKKWNQEFIDKMEKAKDKKDLEEIWQEMQKRAFLSWRLDFEKLKKNAKEFKDLSLENQKKFLFELLDKNQLFVNYSEIDDEIYEVNDRDKKLNREFYK